MRLSRRGILLSKGSACLAALLWSFMPVLDSSSSTLHLLVPNFRLRGGGVPRPSGVTSEAISADAEQHTNARVDIERQLATLRDGVAKAPVQAKESQLQRFKALVERAGGAKGSLVDAEDLQEQTQAIASAFNAADDAFLKSVSLLDPAVGDLFRAKLEVHGGNRTRWLEELRSEHRGDDDGEAEAEKLQALVERMSDVRAWQETGEEAEVPSQEQVQFWQAAEEGDARRLQQLARSGAVKVDLPDPRHYGRATALQRAAMMGKAAAMKALGRLGADGRQRDRHGESVVHTAARQHAVEAVECALALGGAVDGRNCFGQTPLMVALDWGGPLAQRHLSPAELARREAALRETASVLLGRGASPMSADETGWTASHYAARWGRGDVLEMVLEAGGEVTCKTAEGHTPRDWAAAAANTTAAALLRLRRAPASLAPGQSVWDTYGRLEPPAAGEPHPFLNLEASDSESLPERPAPAPAQPAGAAAERAEGPAEGEASCEESPAVVRDMLSRLDHDLALRLAALSDSDSHDTEEDEDEDSAPLSL